MNIAEVLNLKEGDRVTWNDADRIYEVRRNTATFSDMQLVNIVSEKKIEEEHHLASIFKINFKLLDNRKRCNFYDVLHYDHDSPFGVTLIISEVLDGFNIDNDMANKLNIDEPKTIKEALECLTTLLSDNALTCVLLDNEQFIVKEIQENE